MNRKFALFFASALLSLGAFAGVKVTSVDLTTTGNIGHVNVTLDGRSQELPDLRVYGNTIELTLDKASAFNGFSKIVRGAILSANSLNGKAVIRAVLPYAVNQDTVNLSWKTNGIEVNFPRGGAASAMVKPAINLPSSLAQTPAEAILPKAAAPVAVKVTTVSNTTKTETAQNGSKVETKTQTKVSKELLNEDYLNKLMKENSAKKVTPDHKDEISIQQAAIASRKATLPSKVTDNFSFAGYIVKFTVFLALVLGLFYGIVQVLKKGVFKRGKLGFLNNDKMIEVLSTTYVGPKKSLMIVRAHKQLFLVSNSESGLQFLSEMKDTTGIIKEGEKSITGSNFDTNLNFMTNATDEDEPAIKIKENIMESTAYEEPKGLAKLAVAQDIVKFSDELKKKAKKLRPIEFN
jgi:flagellar biogenesis protein FliO